MFELADYLVGIYKVEDCTRSLTIQNCDKQRVLGFGEKENQSESMNVSSEKENSQSDLSQSSEAVENHLNGTSASPPMSQVV